MEDILFREAFGKAFVPKRVLPHLRGYLLKAGVLRVPYKFFGSLFWMSVVITAFLYIVWVNPFLSDVIISRMGDMSPAFLLPFNIFASAFSWFFIQISFSALFMVLVYYYLDVRIYRRTKELEEMLPDYLQVVASNLKGGLTVENALWYGIKPRFKILAREMAEVSKKVMTGFPVQKALRELSTKYASPMLKRSVDLILSELESGGDVADLLDRLVDHLKETKALKDDMSASAITYVIFITVIVILISPLLFALSFHLLELILGFLTSIASATQRTQGLPFTLQGGNVDVGSFKTFSIMAIATIAFFSSMIVSIVEKGEVRRGLRYIPLFLLGSIVFYFLFLRILNLVFGGIL